MPVLVWVELTMTVLLLPWVTTTRLLPMAEAPLDAPTPAAVSKAPPAPALEKTLWSWPGLDHAVDDHEVAVGVAQADGSTGWFSWPAMRP